MGELTKGAERHRRAARPVSITLWAPGRTAHPQRKTGDISAYPNRTDSYR